MLRSATLLVLITAITEAFGGPPIQNINGTVCAGDNASFRVTPGACSITSWIASSGGVFQGSNTGQQVVIKWSTATSNAWVQVNYSNCTASFLAVTVNAKTTPTVTFSITSNASTICQTGNVTFSATMSNGSGSPNYNWYIDNVLKGTTTVNSFSYATSNLSAGNHNAYVTLSALTCSTASSVTSASSSFDVQAAVAITSGPSGTTSRCAGTGTDTYTVSATNATGYTWSISPAGAGSISTSGVVTWDASFSGTATVYVTASGCYGSQPASANLNVVTTAFTVTISNGPLSRCQGEGSDTYVANGCAASYTWTISPSSAGTITGSAAGYVTWSSSFYGTATIGVTANRSNGSPATNYQDVVVKQLPVVPNLDKIICSRDNSSISLTTQLSGSTYTWSASTSNASGASAGSGSSINQVLTNASSTPGSATYTVTPTNSGCVGTNKAIVVTVKPEPVIAAEQKTICSRDNTNITLTTTNSLAGTSYDWSVSTSNVAGASAGSGSSISETLNNVSSGNGIASYTVTPTASGCAGINQNMVITVKPEPVVSAADKLMCSKDKTNISLTTSNSLAETGFSWTSTATNVSGASAGNGPTLDQELSNISSANGTVVYSINSSSNGCSGVTKNIVVTVKPEPVISNADKTICSNQNTNIQLITSNALTTTEYNWSVNSTDVNGWTPGSGPNILQTLTNTSSSDGTATYTIIPITNGCMGASQDVTITVKPEPVLANEDITIKSKENTNITLTTLNGLAGTTYSWSVIATSVTGTANGSGSSISQLLTNSDPIIGSATYSVQPTANGCAGSLKEIVVLVLPYGYAQITGPASLKVGDVANYNVSFVDFDGNTLPSPSVVSVTWSAQPGDLPFVNSSSYSSQIQWSQAGTFTVSYQITTGADVNFPNLQMAATLQVTVKNGYPSPIISATNNGIVENGSAITLSVSNYTYDSYQWLYNDGSSISGATSPTYVTNIPGSYSVRVTKPGVTLTSATKTLVASSAIPLTNNIESNTIVVPGISNEASVDALPAQSKSKLTQYFDGLGRPVQSVSWQASPQQRDIITAISYDEFGRETKKYLPYADGINGGFKMLALRDPGSTTNGPDDYRSGEQYAFYQSENTLASDEFPYAETIFEASPLNRPLKHGAPGEVWQPLTEARNINDKTLKIRYGSNVVNEVLLWTYDPTTRRVNAQDANSNLVYYGTNKLQTIRTYDEHNNLLYEYIDEQGRMLLKRVQATSSQAPVNDTNYAGTYYIYDDFGNLAMVIPAEAVAKLPSSYHNASPADQETFLSNWTFRYKYDSRKRMIEKQVPGAQPVYMVYDNRDRLALTQDGNQRATAPYLWSFTKYDELNRPVLTGIKDTAVDVGQAVMQDVVNAHYAKAGAKWGETRSTDPGNIHGYTNDTYPVYTSDSITEANHYLTVNYYDDYDFKDQWLDDYSYSNDGLSDTVNGVVYNEPVVESLRLIGQVTGSKTKVLDGGVRGGYTWLKSVNYYDEKYRVIQTISDNYKGGNDKVTNLYDFTGKVLKTKTRHSTNEMSWEGLVNMTVAGNNLHKTFLGLGWNSGAVTREQLPAGVDGWIECVISEATQRRAFGLTATNEGEHYNTIDYAFFHDATTARVYENGSLKYELPETVKSGDVIRIERAGTQMKYYRNGILLYTTNNASTGALIGDAGIDTGSGNILVPRASFSHRADSVSRRFVYDHAGRLKEIWHQINATPEVRIAYNEYNEIGQLIDKKLHSTAALASNAVQSIDYKYNIRGWLTGMNEQDLSNGDPGDPTDYFSFQLGYNEDIGLQNIPMYNGNISGMKWSRNLGLTDTIMNAYVYSYDAMNRLAGAAYKIATGSPGMPNWTQPATNEFSATQYDYDLNGNILALTRKGKNGSDMDVLAYDYGNGVLQSNQLLKVSDSGSKTEGFAEIEGEGDDYRYDNNGNLLWDKNKGGQEVLQNGGFSSGSANWVVTDTGGRLTFQDDSLIVTSHATASATIKQNDIILKKATYVVVVDMERDAGSITFNIGFGGNRSVSANGKTVFTYQAGSGNDFVVTIPVTFAGRIKSIEVKGIVVISYNYLNLPEKIVKGLQQSLGYIYDAMGRKISQEVYDESGLIIKKSDYEGEFFYENDTLRFINHEEGRVIMSGPEPEYQYNLKDHLGNVRLTFTTKPDEEQSLATLETVNVADEQVQFLNYDEAIKVNYDLFDHTYDGTTGDTYYSTRLTGGNTNAIYGLAKSLSVMPGDTIKMEVFAKYLDPDENNWSAAMTSFMSAVAGGTAPQGTVVDGGSSGSIGTGSFPYGATFDHSTEEGTAPKAYLNYIVFDRDFHPIIGESGFIRITTACKENGSNVSHDILKNESLAIKQAGYVYIYLSNENETAVEVFFDDFKVEHIKSPVVKMDDYYPFGLTFNSYQRENSVDQRWKFQGQEHIDDLGLNWDSFKWRNHQPDIGRFFNIDPLAEKYVHNSPYAFSENKVTSHVELEGLEAENFMSKFKKPSELALKPVPSGRGVQDQRYTVVVQNPSKGVSDLRSTFKDKPQSVLSNSKADFQPVDGDGNKLEHANLQEGSFIEIAIPGPLNNSTVKVTGETSDANGFSFTFGTLEGHIEAGQITFSATQDKDGNVTFSINSTSKIDSGYTSLFAEGTAREEQAASWQEVLTNVVKYLGGTETSRGSSKRSHDDEEEK